LDKSIFSIRLKEGRKNLNLTQQQLADKLNNLPKLTKKISRVSIARYENGTREPDLITLSAIAFILDVDVDYLIGNSDKKNMQNMSNCIDSFSKHILEFLNEHDNFNTNSNVLCILASCIECIEISGDNPELLESTASVFVGLREFFQAASKVNNSDAIFKLNNFIKDHIYSR